jgi:hypothetical protein
VLCTVCLYLLQRFPYDVVWVHENTIQEARVIDPLAQQILDLIYRDSAMRRTYKDALTDWILDTQFRTDPLNTRTLLDYLAAHQSDVLNRLKINVRIKDAIARVLEGAALSQVSLD